MTTWFRSILTLLATATTALLLSACASQAPKGTLYWGDYSDTLYEYKQAPGAETLAAHMTELQRIIQLSDDHSYRIPPGVCAELGLLYQRAGQPQQAESLFTREQVLYPESSVFMSTFMQPSSAESVQNPDTTANPSESAP